jgi:hypothetical protein
MATISDAAFEYSNDSEKAYEIACLVLTRILKDASLKREFVDRRLSPAKYSHLSVLPRHSLIRLFSRKPRPFRRAFSVAYADGSRNLSEDLAFPA